MKNIIKNISKIFIFILIFIIIYSIMSYLKKPKKVDLDNINGIYSEEKNSLDVVYIGGSASFVYFEPLMAFEDYGIVSYDYGANTIQCEFYKYMIKEVLKNQSPELIIIDARAFQYREKDQVPTSVAYRNVLTGMRFSENKIDLINNTVKQNLNDGRLSYLFDLILYHSNSDDLEITKSMEMLLGKYDNKYKGFYFVPKAERQQKEDFYTTNVGKIAEETDEILDDLLNYLDSIDSKILFVVSPYIETEDEKEMFNYIENRVEEAGYDFIDANEYADEMDLNYDTDFYNYNHVNILGADKYTKFLSNYLINNYDLEDRRKDSNYKNWFNYLPKWKKEHDDVEEKIKEIIEGDDYYEYISIKQ